uniref:Melanoma cell adhesion molecule n=1 Tax=Leptobrachium leishanense TaxID=445787 RepID=A0A8C5MT39_9ANUR
MDFLILLSLCLVSWTGSRARGSFEYVLLVFRGKMVVVTGTWGKKDGSLAQVVIETEVGRSAKIPCAAYSPENAIQPTIHWFYEKNGKKQKILTSGTSETIHEDAELNDRVKLESDFMLVISDIRVQDERFYLCLVENTNSAPSESKLQLRVYKAPELLEMKLDDAPLQLNDKVEVGTCESKNGFPISNITWYKNGFPVNSMEDVEVTYLYTTESSGLITILSTLSMTIKQSDNEAEIYCEVSYHLPGGDYMLESKTGNLTVYYPNKKVEIFQERPEGLIKEGDTVELKCVGDGNPQPEINFYKSGFEDVRLGSGTSLIMENIRRENSGGYKCQGIDYNNFEDDLSAETEVHVHFLDQPMFSVSSPRVMNEGETLSVSCEAKGSTAPVVTWKTNGNDVSNGSILNLKQVDHDMSGNYTCIVHSPDVQDLIVSKELQIFVAGTPKVSVTSLILYVDENQQVTVSCTAIGYPAADIMWSINGSTTERRDELEVTSELTFNVTQDLIDTSIICLATNENGSNKAEIKVEQRLVSTVTSATISVTETSRESSHGVVIVVVIVCILLLAILGAVLYFLYKKGRISCGRSGKQDITKPSEKEQIVVEMKPDSPVEESVLLPGSQEKKPPGDQDVVFFKSTFPSPGSYTIKREGERGVHSPSVLEHAFQTNAY